MFHRATLLLLSLVIVSTSLAMTPAMDAIRDGEQRQQQIRSRVAQVASQLDAIIAEFDRNGLGDGEDVRSLRAIRSVLSELSDRDMEQVVVLLRQARGAAAGDDAKARHAAGDAYVTQQTILARLRGLLAEFHRQQSLQQLAAKLAALATREGASLKSTVDLARAVGSKTPEQFPESANESLRLSTTSQQTLNAEVSDALEVMRYLADKADGPAAQRLRQAIAAVEGSKLADLLTDALTDLRGANLYRAATNQKSIRDTLQQAAALLSPQADSVASLRAAADDLDHLIEQQKQLADQTAQAKNRNDLAAAESKQAQIVQSTDAARQGVENRSPAAAQSMEKAIDAMQQARAALTDRKSGAANNAAQKQAAALAELERAKAQLQDRIAQAQAERDRQAQADAKDGNPTTRNAADGATTQRAELERKQKELAGLLEKIKEIRAKQQQLADSTAPPSSTQPVSPADAGRQRNQAAANAPQQRELANAARAAQEQAASGEQSQAAAAKELADAGKEMDRAADAMGKRDPASAHEDQKDADAALARAADEVARAQQQLADAQHELDQAEKSREAVAQLIKDQQDINQATAQAAAAAEAAQSASKQDSPSSPPSSAQQSQDAQQQQKPRDNGQPQQDDGAPKHAGQEGLPSDPPLPDQKDGQQKQQGTKTDQRQKDSKSDGAPGMPPPQGVGIPQESERQAQQPKSDGSGETKQSTSADQSGKQSQSHGQLQSEKKEAQAGRQSQDGESSQGLKQGKSDGNKPGADGSASAGGGQKPANQPSAAQKAAAAAAAAAAQQAAAQRAQDTANKMGGGQPGGSPGGASGAAANVSSAGASMSSAGDALANGDVNGARPQQKEAVNALVKAKQTLDDRIHDLKKQLGKSSMDPQQAQDTAQALADAMKELEEAQRSLRGSNDPSHSGQAIDDAQKHLQQAAKAAAEAAAKADAAGVTDAAAKALPDLSDAAAEASAGDVQDASNRAAQAQQSLAEAQAALAVAQAQSGMQPGMKPGQQSGNARGAVAQQTDEQAGPSNDVQAPERDGSGKAMGQRAADPNDNGRRNAVSGAGAYQGLPARDRRSLQQSQKDKYPEEYGPMIEQYLKSLAEEGKK